MHNTILDIKNLSVSIDNKHIINNLDLEIKAGAIHAIMGPNGAGKSTLAHFLTGRPEYIREAGSVSYLGADLLALTPEERAWQGIYLSFQYPVAIQGVSNIQFLKTSLNAIRKKRNLPPLDAVDILQQVKNNMRNLQMDEALLYRSINEGFSGGEKKRNEILQMSLLEPTLAILDETDSGLDIDALKAVADGVNALRAPTRALLIITHYQRLLDYIEPDYIHVLHNGRIIHSGDKSLGPTLEQKGYGWLTEATQEILPS